jgi:hypothetical protein
MTPQPNPPQEGTAMNATAPIEYLPLPDAYKDHSMTFRLVKRVGMVAMFAAGTLEWEVMVIQRQKAAKFPNGKTYPPKEVVPSPEQWGQYGWTYTHEARAKARFDMLVEDQKERLAKQADKAGITTEP